MRKGTFVRHSLTPLATLTLCLALVGCQTPNPVTPTTGDTGAQQPGTPTAAAGTPAAPGAPAAATLAFTGKAQLPTGAFAGATVSATVPGKSDVLASATTS